MKIIHTLTVVAAALAAQNFAFAATVADFTKVYEGAGQAVDLNNARQVLLRSSDTSFTVLDLVKGTSTIVNLSSVSPQGTYTKLVANDLSNTGFVTGFLDDTTPFFWSASGGVKIVPQGFGGKFVNDSGVTIGHAGTWSNTGGTVAVSIPGNVTSFNNVEQLGYVSDFIANPGNPGGQVNAGVMSTSGQSTLALSYTANAYNGFPDINDQFNMPDLVVINDVGQAVVDFFGVKVYPDSGKLYTGATLSSGVGYAVRAINVKGQMIGSNNPNAMQYPLCGCYSSTAEPVVIDISSLTGFGGALVQINDDGLMLHSKPDSFALYQAPNGSGQPPIVVPATGTGLKGEYFNQGLLGKTLVATRVENPDFDWGTARPAAAVHTDFFSVKWTGSVQADSTGVYRLRTLSDDGVRVTVNGQKVIDHWTSHKAATDTSADIAMEAGKRYDITVEYYELIGTAVMRLSWLKPGATSFTAIPLNRLYQP
ncbi:PA14 domain-containing protein [Aquabacterium sp.]|uniref:PA14 domain-containing protein n=1 Tax=Aquabacterium sp. TaxID=1872578 RepID=UPI0019963843|nr:PA14 domain-containing protein [Aquabacterium sp.]MBC7702127.1 hypothetical protein [Aquabacterium sp.]